MEKEIICEVWRAFIAFMQQVYQFNNTGAQI